MTAMTQDDRDELLAAAISEILKPIVKSFNDKRVDRVIDRLMTLVEDYARPRLWIVPKYYQADDDD
jgi:hypothetical protein